MGATGRGARPSRVTVGQDVGGRPRCNRRWPRQPRARARRSPATATATATSSSGSAGRVAGRAAVGSAQATHATSVAAAGNGMQPVGSAEVADHEDEHTEADMQKMMDASGSALDRLFLEEMLPHHAGAITMSHSRSSRSTVRVGAAISSYSWVTPDSAATSQIAPGTRASRSWISRLASTEASTGSRASGEHPWRASQAPMNEPRVVRNGGRLGRRMVEMRPARCVPRQGPTRTGSHLLRAA